jgi:hypothetical protein
MTHTIADSLGVICNKLRTLTHTATVHSNTPSARTHKLTGATRNALRRERAGAGFAQRRAGRTCAGRVEELAIGARRGGGVGRGSGNASSAIVGVGSEAGLAGRADTGGSRAAGAALRAD